MNVYNLLEYFIKDRENTSENLGVSIISVYDSSY